MGDTAELGRSPIEVCRVKKSSPEETGEPFCVTIGMEGAAVHAIRLTDGTAHPIQYGSDVVLDLVARGCCDGRTAFELTVGIEHIGVMLFKPI